VDEVGADPLADRADSAADAWSDVNGDTAAVPAGDALELS
jgi:hypothetical protein